MDALIKVLQPEKGKSVDSQVKCMAVWAIGRIANLQTIKKSQRVMVAALNDAYFKVRSAACGALVSFGQSADCHSPEFHQLA